MAAAGEGEVRRDMWGQEYRTSSAECAAALDAYYAAFLSFGRGRVAKALRAAAADPTCALASAHAAHAVAPRDPAGAAAFLAAAADNLANATEYERAVFGTLSAMVGEQRNEEVALQRHLELLKSFPKDILSLKRAQLICFYLGKPDLSLKFVEQVLPENQDQNYIYGMLAFPLLELGKMDEAERAARKGLAINKNDVWSQHNLCHVFQQECRFREATEFMESCSPSWTACTSFLLTHNWWHVAVCYLEAESPLQKVLDVYDQNIMKELEKSDCEAAEVYLNALGLLLRLYVRGHVHPAKERLTTFLDALKDESLWHVEWLLDLLILWALSSTGELKSAQNMLESLNSRVSSMDKDRQQVMQKALQLAEAVYEFGNEEHKKVFDTLGPDFDALGYKMIGASDEQVDVFNEVWHVVLISAGESSKAIDVLVKQIRKREGAPFLWRLLGSQLETLDTSLTMTLCRIIICAGGPPTGDPRTIRRPSWHLWPNQYHCPITDLFSASLISLSSSLSSPTTCSCCFACALRGERGDEMKEEMVVGLSAPGPGPVGRWGAAPPQALLERMKDYGQEGAFALWDDLSPEDRELLVRDIESIDLSRIDRIIRRSLGSQGMPLPAVEPVPESSVSKVEDRSPEDKERWWKKGLKAISEGKLAVVLLAGGQGTRLGSSDPKGCFNIGLPSGKSLFQLQAERILCVQKLAAQSSESPSNTVPIHWYIMTSPFTDAATRKFFETRRYFGLDADQVTFFQQGTLPCISADGRFIMETPYQVAKAPDGNGGVYAALKSKKLMEDMAARGVKYVDCYGVDNALVRVADPTFLGYFIDKGVCSAAKVVRKAYPQENVGVFVQRGRGGPLSVVEYSEMDAAMTTEINQSTGRLRYCWSNICLHMFTLDFLNQVANSLEKDSVYHLAEKKIPSIHGYTTGLKLEQFIFDAFTYSPSTALFEVMREEEFAPVKNANGATYDTPDSAKLMLLRLHSRWVVAAGGFLTHSVPLYMTGVEVSPLSSYAGENLEAICRGRTFHAPSEISF